MSHYRVESLLAARLFQSPQTVGDRLFFLSNLGGQLSLYAMDHGGSVPEPLLPGDIALHNPHLIGGHPFYVLPRLDRILVMIDRDGDEVYRPHSIPIDGGYPEPLFAQEFGNHRVHLQHVDGDSATAYFMAQRLDAPMIESWRADLASGVATKYYESPYGSGVAGVSEDGALVAMVEGYTVGDSVLTLWRPADGIVQPLFGTALDERSPGHAAPLLGLGACAFVEDDAALLVTTTVHDDRGGLAKLSLAEPVELRAVPIVGIVHSGSGELTGFERLQDDRFLLSYNIDGCSWLYEGEYDSVAGCVRLDRVVVGRGALADGVVDAHHYDKDSQTHAISFSTAISPTQLFTILRDSPSPIQHTHERLLALPQSLLSAGEDASFTSHDGLRVSARLYLPAAQLGFDGPRPLVYYVHGGPQGQERPDFSWFSMPLIQLLTLRGFAVFVPNARGSTGYGQAYTKHVDRDWGGQDRLDHVFAMTEVLPNDARVDVKRAAVVGRSYGGYMTLTLAARHPELWRAACDMFGPYDLFTFLERIPETWKTYFKLSLGDPNDPADRAFLVERSPKTHLDAITCPLLVIQGANDPRVVAAESEDVVARLKADGKDVEFLLFEDEGHDVLKYGNRVRCYEAIAGFFADKLGGSGTA
ncbi:MAG: prolyl oligopeptidase family serine peptidase [Ardenticatenales bacterium]